MVFKLFQFAAQATSQLHPPPFLTYSLVDSNDLFPHHALNLPDALCGTQGAAAPLTLLAMVLNTEFLILLSPNNVSETLDYASYF